jgi:flagellar protein FliS
MSFGAKNYKQTLIKTATPEQVLLMLYEAAIKHSKLAVAAIEKKNITEKCASIGKVHDIIMELRNTLDHSKGPEVANQLDALYEFCIAQLFKANMNNDIAAIQNITKILTTLHEGWVAAVEEVKKKGKAPNGQK